MDTNKIIARAKSTLLTPRTEWPIIAAETDTVANLYTGYILVMAAIPAVMMFLSSALIGVSVPFLGTYRVGVASGISYAVVTYAATLVGVYVVALIVDALAPTFSGQKNQVQALKTVAYAYTASWVASIVGIVPGLALLAALAGAAYGIYLLYLGLPFTMKCPQDKAGGYTAVTIVVAIVVAVVLNAAAGAVIGGRLSLAGRPTPPQASGGFAPGSTGAALESWTKNMEAASKKMEAAQKSGDANAQANAVGQMVGAALGAAGKVEALAPDRIKQFVPDSLAGLPRTRLSAERNTAMGVQVSEARASYSDGGERNLDLEITDTGTLHGLVGFAAGWAGVEQEQQTDSGYQKTYKDAGRLVHEQWDSRNHHGQYAVVVGDRFTVSVSGGGADISELKAAAARINLAGLEALKSEGIQAN